MIGTRKAPEGYKPGRSAQDRCTRDDSAFYLGAGAPPKKPEDVPQDYRFKEDFVVPLKDGGTRTVLKAGTHRLTPEFFDYWRVGGIEPPCELVRSGGR